MSWTVHEHIGADELSIVLVGCEHVGSNALAAGLGRQCTYDIVGLESICLQDRDVISLQ